VIQAEANFWAQVFGLFGVVPVMPPPMDLRLFQNDLVIDPALTISQFTEATFSGYSTDTTTWQGPFLDDSGLYHMTRNATFTHNDGATANTIYGWYAKLDDGDGGGPWIAEKWATPVGMESGVDQITFLAELKPPLPVGDSPPNS